MVKIYVSKEVTIDHKLKIGMIKKNKLLIEKYFEKNEIDMEINKITDDVWEAISIACKYLYPDVKDLETIGKRAAASILDERVSRQTLDNKVKEGYLRTKDNKFILNEIKQVKILLDLFELFVKIGAILPTKDVNGKDVYAVIPKSVTIKGRSEVDQKIVAAFHLIKSPGVQKFLEVFSEQKQL